MEVGREPRGKGCAIQNLGESLIGQKTDCGKRAIDSVGAVAAGEKEKWQCWEGAEKKTR